MCFEFTEERGEGLIPGFPLSESLVGDANSLLSNSLAFGIMMGAGKEDSELFVSFLKLLTPISKISVYKDPVSLFPSKQP